MKQRCWGLLPDFNLQQLHTYPSVILNVSYQQFKLYEPAQHRDAACRIVDRDGALLDMPANSLYDSMTLIKHVTALQERLGRKPTVREMAKAVSRPSFYTGLAPY